MFNKLFTAYEDEIDWRSKDSLHGNTALHMACLQENVEIAQKIYKHE